MLHTHNIIYIGTTKIVIVKPHGDLFNNEWYVNYFDKKWWAMETIKCSRNDLIKKVKQIRKENIIKWNRKLINYRCDGYTRC